MVSLTKVGLADKDFKDAVYQNLSDESFDAGHFCSELKQMLSPGHYQVDVYYHRNNLGTIQFTIIE